MKKISTVELVLLSTGGMIGAGWLFSPYYAFQMSGFGSILSWIIAAIMTGVIGLSFAEIVTFLPIVGGASRFISITHSKSIGFVFLILGWLGYVVYLPIEVQSGIQYLGFWFHGLVISHANGVTLSYKGLGFAVVVIIFLTFFNSMFLGKIIRANSIISLWKILIPLIIAWILIFCFGDWNNISLVLNKHQFSFESILSTITSTGVAFAFTGFQNGIILANSVKNKNALFYSLFAPLLMGVILYCSLSLAFIFCLGTNSLNISYSAPLLGLVGLFSLHIISTVLFIDAVVAPIGTANVYTAVTARILLSVAQDFLPNSIFTKLNRNMAPIICLWFNCLLGICFLLPLPTWQQIINFLSSIVVFTYLSGPIVLIILRDQKLDINRKFYISNYKLIGKLGFISCSLLIYWSGFNNLVYLIGLVFLILIFYHFVVDKKIILLRQIKFNLCILGYLGFLVMISLLRKKSIILFPFDNLLVLLIGLLCLRFFLLNRLGDSDIKNNIAHYEKELI